MLKERLRSIPAARALRAKVHAAAPRAYSVRRLLGRRLLTAGLVVVYFAVITPIAIVRRVLLGRSLAHPGLNAERGWRRIRQASADKRIYLSDD